MGLLEDRISRIGALDEGAMQAARLRQDKLTKPQGSLGKLEELSIKIAGITGKAQPRIERKVIITMAGDHGVAEAGVSLYPQEVTVQMVQNFLTGGAGINVLSRLIGARVTVVDMGVKTDIDGGKGLVREKIGRATRNMIEGPAMTARQARDSVEAGIRIFEAELEKGLDIVGTGDMGIGNTTPSSAICAAMTGKSAADVTGRGTGVGNEQLNHKVQVVQKALDVNHPEPSNALDVLAKVGGFEIGGIAGVILGAAANRVPVVIDGFISGAGAMIAAGLSPRVKDYMIASHLSVEPGHRAMLEYLGAKPLLNLDLRLGEGTGGCLGIFLCEAATRILSEMATFEQAGVSTAEEK
ncbi:MAG: nicotinate-nucleotide--dimethylbenzimidazole phosphoribosyltransferase [Dehalococcoidia bacterium]|nr:nicotinate-nucleotide--dimethylbenzimidazole phosphoribosyltransferase [Dehalococcoidia bacterium]